MSVVPAARSRLHTRPGRTTPVPGVDHVHARRWLILAVLGIAQLMVVLDATIMNVALPSAQRALGFSNTDRQWVVTAYALSFGSLLLLGGRLSDLLGRRRTFIVGLAGFAGASALGGAANGFAMLVSARAAQGVFGALLAPAALSLLTTTFTDPRERGKAFGIFGALAGAGGAVGLLLGGALTTYASWRWALYINLAFAAVAIAGATTLLPRQIRDARATLDVKGTLAVSAGLFALVYGFSHAETSGWADPLTVAMLVASVVLLVLFGYLQSRVESPLLPPRVVLDRNRGAAYLAMFIVGSGMFAVFLFLTYYLQVTLGYSAIRTGLAFLPMVVGLVITASLSTVVLLPRFGARILITLGMVVAAAGMTIFAQLTLHGDYVGQVLPGLLVMGVGLGLVFAPSLQTAVTGVDPADAGVASAMVNTSQQVGGSIGVALLSTIAGTAATGYLHGRAATPQLLALATMHSYTTTFWVASGIFAGGALLIGSLLRSGTPAAQSVGLPAAGPAFAH